MNLATPIPENIPPELRAEARWVVARIEERDGKDTKVPYRPLNPTRRADSTDATTWSDFATAWQLIECGEFPMLGFVLGSGFVGVDLDKCRNPETGTIESWAEDIVNRLGGYSEVSVSGTGVHVICRGALPPGRRRKARIEMYESARYFVVTGHGTPAPIEDRTTELATLHADIFGEATDASSEQSADRHVERGNALTDDELLDVARRASNGAKFQRLWSGDISGYSSRSEADLALCRRLAFYAQGDAARIDRLFRQSRLYRPKWSRRDYSNRTIATAIAGTSEFYEPPVEIPDVPLDADAPAVDFDLDTAIIEVL